MQNLFLKTNFTNWFHTFFFANGFLGIHTEEDFLWILLWLLIAYFIFLFIKIKLRTVRGIHQAILDNNSDLVEKYLNNGINIDIENDRGMTPLMIAICHNSQHIVKLLISRGANINYNLENSNKTTPIYESLISGHSEMTNFLLSNGAVLDYQAAAYQGNIEIVNKHIKQGIDVNSKGYQGKTLLHIAVENNQLELVKFLLDRNADVNIQDAYRRTPLHFAASNSDGDELIELLIGRGAELNILAKETINFDKCRDGTPLHIAIRYNYVNIAEVLINKGAEVNIRYGVTGDTLLMDAVSGHRNCYDVVQLLLAHGAEVNAYDKFQGETALHKVVYWGHIDIAELLITHGAKVNFRDFSGNTPLASAEISRNPDMYSFLVRCGATL